MVQEILELSNGKSNKQNLVIKKKKKNKQNHFTLSPKLK